MSATLKKTKKSTIGRHLERGSYDRAAAHAIFDEGLVAHVGFDTGDGVVVVPMTYARLGDEIVLHGAAASRWLSSFAEGRDISICVTLLDGLVLARSAFAHSMNYRSVVAFGRAVVVDDDERKGIAFHALLDHLVPGRWEDCRQPNRKEIDATTVLSMRLDEASVKVRSGPPKDAAKDMQLDYWAGVIPLALQASWPIPDPANAGGAQRGIPSYAGNYARRRR
jgi:nitroimidazol reductase NimA-like FMN-containing flavoprotein (pyridoxamine 5'-phosphate oxidase superfamily)